MDSENGAAGKVPLGHLVFTSPALEWEDLVVRETN